MTLKKRPQWIPVVTALIVKNSQILVGCRPKNKNLAGLWEFPGGKIEAGESPEEALVRELSEELDIEAKIGELKLAGTHSYGDTGIMLLFYTVRYWNGEPKSHHHSELKWVNISELDKLEQPDANKKLLPRIIAALNNE